MTGMGATHSGARLVQVADVLLPNGLKWSEHADVERLQEVRGAERGEEQVDVVPVGRFEKVLWPVRGEVVPDEHDRLVVDAARQGGRQEQALEPLKDDLFVRPAGLCRADHGAGQVPVVVVRGPVGHDVRPVFTASSG